MMSGMAFFEKQLRGEKPLPFETAGALMKAAQRYQQLKPWELLREPNVMLVAAEGGGEHACIVIGSMGKVTGLVVYPSPDGYETLRRVHSSGLDESPLEFMNCVMVEFVTRRELQKPDRELLAKFPVPKNQRVPFFRTTRPRYLPWFINEAEGRVLLHCLNAVIPLIESRRNYWLRPDEYPLVETDGVRLVERAWRPLSEPMPPPEDPEEVARIRRQFAPERRVMQVDFLMVPVPIGENDVRPFAMRAGMVCDAASGFAFAPSVVSPDVSEGAALRQAFIGALEASGHLPSTVEVKSQRHKTMLSGLLTALGVQVKVRTRLAAMEEMQGAMLGFVRGDRR